MEFLVARGLRFNEARSTSKFHILLWVLYTCDSPARMDRYKEEWGCWWSSYLQYASKLPTPVTPYTSHVYYRFSNSNLHPINPNPANSTGVASPLSLFLSSPPRYKALCHSTLLTKITTAQNEVALSYYVSYFCGYSHLSVYVLFFTPFSIRFLWLYFFLTEPYYFSYRI